MSTRVVLVTLAVAINVAVLLTSRPHWFSDLNDHVVRSQSPLYSDPLDLTTVGVFTWRVPTAGLPAPDYASLFLELVRTSQMPRYGSQHVFSLRVRIEAEGESENDPARDRFVRTYLSLGSEPAITGVRWVGDHAERRLGRIAILPRETLTIRVEVLRPDPALAEAVSRLMLVPEYDAAVLGHMPALSIFRDACLLAAFLAVVFLGLLSWQGPSRRPDYQASNGAYSVAAPDTAPHGAALISRNLGRHLESTQAVLGGILTVTSFLVSCLLVAYGTGLLFAEEVPGWAIAFGVATVAYGLCSVAVLVMAWCRYGSRATEISRYLAIGFMIVFLLASLDTGMVSGLELLGLFFVAGMLFINWLAVSAVVRLRGAT